METTTTVSALPVVDGECTIVCTGEFDRDTVALVADACAEPAASMADVLLIDVTHVEFADSSLLNLLIWLRNRRRLVLGGPLPDQFQRLLEMAGLENLFDVRATT